MRDEVLPPATPPDTSITVFSRTGMVLEVVGEKVGIPLARPPVLVPFAAGAVVVVLVVWLGRGWFGAGDGGFWQDGLRFWLTWAVYFAAYYPTRRVLTVIVREHSTRWRVGVVLPDPRNGRGRWVLRSETLPRGVDPRSRMEQLLADVRTGRMDARRTRFGVRAVCDDDPALGTTRPG